MIFVIGISDNRFIQAFKDNYIVIMVCAYINIYNRKITSLTIWWELNYTFVLYY